MTDTNRSASCSVPRAISLAYAKHQAALREPASFGLSLEFLRLVRRNERDMTEAHMRIWYLVWFQERMQAALAMAEQVPSRPQETTLEKRARLMGEIMGTFSPDSLATADDSGDTEILHDMGQSMAKVMRLKFKVTSRPDARASIAARHLCRAQQGFEAEARPRRHGAERQASPCDQLSGVDGSFALMSGRRGVLGMNVWGGRLACLVLAWFAPLGKRHAVVSFFFSWPSEVL